MQKPKLIHKERIPEGGVLVIPNRLRFDDIKHFEKLLPGRSVVYLLEKGQSYDPAVLAHMEGEGVEAFEFSEEGGMVSAFTRQLGKNIENGDAVIFVPGLCHARRGQNIEVLPGTLEFLLDGGAPVLPVFIDHRKETRLTIERSRESGRTVFSFAALLEGNDRKLARFQEEILLAGEAAFSSRPILKSHIAYALLAGLKKHGARAKVIDGFDGSEMTYDKVLAAAIVLSKHVKEQTSQPRVGIILPPGKAGLIANLAVLFAGKIPVNINFTAGDRAVASSIEQAELDKFITVDPFVRKMSRFNWPPNKQLILVERLLPRMKPQITRWFLLAKILPARMLASLLHIPRKGGSEEAVLLFTSGSSGDPKGVVLSHRNLLGNVNQFGARIALDTDDRVLGCLPLFHSFGCTVTLWYPVIEGLTLVTYPNPLEAPKLADLIDKYSISMVLATPTFLRGYLRRARKEQFHSVKLVVTGAEKLPRKVAESFEEKFGMPVLEGYGLTETSPVTNVNLPEVGPDDPGDKKPVLPNRRPGSVGHPIPGVAVRITEAETDKPLPLHETGMILLRGANIFEGYLNEPEKTGDVLKDGWLKTGDIGRMDKDGFLYIEGRLSRFSKIGGEMVPHESVEVAINDALGFDSEGERKIAVVGVPDESKGESLVLIIAVPGLDATDLRYRLLDRGFPSLWIPKAIVEVQEIPHLASGKLDLKACERMIYDA